MARVHLLLIIPASLLFFLLVLATTSMAAAGVTNILYSGESLKTGEYLAYGEPYGLIMQADCNLVLYEYKKPIWASNTGGRARDCYCTMQVDGNLVVYTPDGRPIWASNTARGKGNYVLILQKDRNLVIYGGAIWASNTYIRHQGMEPIVITRTSTDNVDLKLPSSSQVVV